MIFSKPVLSELNFKIYFPSMQSRTKIKFTSPQNLILQKNIFRVRKNSLSA